MPERPETNGIRGRHQEASSSPVPLEREKKRQEVKIQK